MSIAKSSPPSPANGTNGASSGGNGTQNNTTNNNNDAPTSPHAKPWPTLLTKCLRERVPPARFALFAQLLSKKQRPRGADICAALLEPQLFPPAPAPPPTAANGNGAGAGATRGLDPLVPAYAGQLLRLRAVSAAELLAAVLRFSRVGSGGGGDARVLPWELEEALLGLVAARCTEYEGTGGAGEARAMLGCAAEWMGALVEAEHRAVMMQGVDVAGEFHQQSGMDAESAGRREGVGRVVAAVADSAAVVRVLDEGGAGFDAAKRLAETISAFIPLLSNVSIPLANRLDLFQRSHEVLQHRPTDGFGGEEADNLDVAEMQIGNIVDRPVAHGRASSVIYLDALLSELPRINDSALLAYLRLKGDSESSIIELITASFDLLAMVSMRGDSPDKTFLYRTFIVNKVPLLMSGLSRMAFMPPNFALLISQAFARLQSNGFPSYDSAFGMGPNSTMLTDMRREFLVACVLHGHVAKENIKELTGEDSTPSLPAAGKLTKDVLIADYQNNPQNLEQLMNGLEGMGGNAGATAEAVVQILHNLCSNRDTMALKNLCHLLTSKRHAIDSLFLYRSSAVILRPLCRVLDEWKYDEDQGEYQPVYDEFSACLLFLIACISRFSLSASDIGVSADDGFVSWVLDRGFSTQSIKDLSEEQSKQLAGWARGLFELEGISDDVMSICPPQDFYKLVPTIFTQSLLARRVDAITVKALENGTELLLELFLLPCMVFGIQCLGNQYWVRKEGSLAMMQVLHKLISPSSKSGEASALHDVVVSILKPVLQDLLAELRCADAVKAQDVDTLLEKLNAHASFARAPYSLLKDSGTWNAAAGSNMLFDFRNSFDTLCSWSMPAALIQSVPPYSHQHVLLAVDLCGASRVLRALVESLTAHAQAGMVDVALDVATSLVCAHEAANLASNAARSTVSHTLRQALQLARDDAAAAIAKEPLRAEMVVLLHRRVETLLAAMPVDDMQALAMQPMNMAMGIDMNQGIGMDMAQDISMDMSMAPDMGVDMGAMDMNMDMTGMMPMDGLGMEQGQGDMNLGQTTQTLDFGGAAGAVSASENTFALEIDTSFGGGQDVGGQGQTDADGNELDEDGRRTSVEDIWSGLGLDFT